MGLEVFLGFSGGGCGKEPTCQSRRYKRRRFDPWVRGGHGNSLQYSCPENPVDEEAGGLQSIGSQRVEHD